MRVDSLDLKKGGGDITGAAYVAWEGRYSFNADGRRIPVESVTAVKFEKAPLSGVAQFTASGSSTFLVPRWDLDGRIEDVYMGDEGIGLVTGHLAYRDKLLTMEFEAASPRLAVSGTGQVEMTPTSDTNLSLRFNKTSLDPYVRAFQPKLSPFTRAEATGTIRVVGQLADPERLMVDITAEDLSLRLFDYDLKNDGPVRIRARSQRAAAWHPGAARRASPAQPVVLVGKDTRLELSGTAHLQDDRVDVKAVGDANLAILQAFFRDIRSSGRARLVGGDPGVHRDTRPVRRSAKSPTAASATGVCRTRSRTSTGASRSAPTASRWTTCGRKWPAANVRFGGRIEMNGLTPGRLSLTATGEGHGTSLPRRVPVRSSTRSSTWSARSPRRRSRVR